MAAIDISNIDSYPYTYDFKGSERGRLMISSLGDNYEERKSKGINTIVSSFSVTFFFPLRSQAQEFVSLLRNSVANEAHFLWKAPLSDEIQRFVIDEWEISGESPEFFNIRCTLRRWHGN
jgi:phage-related protein